MKDLHEEKKESGTRSLAIKVAKVKDNKVSKAKVKLGSKVKMAKASKVKVKVKVSKDSRASKQVNGRHRVRVAAPRIA